MARVCSARAPGKVIVCGEHAVVHGKTAIAGAIGIYTQVQVRRPAERKEAMLLRLVLCDFGVSLEWPLELIESVLKMPEADPTFAKPCTEEMMLVLKDLLERNQAWQQWLEDNEARPLVKGAAHAVLTFLYLHTCILGLQPALVTVKSEIPIGAGLGSSAAYSVALCASLLASSQKSVHTMPSEEWQVLPEVECDLVNSWAFQAEQILHGKASGIDNTVCTYGNIVKFQNGKATMLKDSPALKILVTNTRVGRNTRELVARVRCRLEKYPLVLSSVFQAVHEISEVIFETLQSMKDSDDDIQTRLEELIEINQGLLQGMGVSPDFINDICTLTEKHGLKSKLTGAGGGGSVMTLLLKSTPSEKLQQTIAVLESRGYQCMVVDLGCRGVQIMQS